MKKFNVIFFLILSISTFSQKSIEVNAVKYKMALPKNMTMEELEKRCLEQAKLKAIETYFGTRVSEITVNYITESKTLANQSFASLTNTLVNGEWVRDTKEPEFRWICSENTLELEAIVSGIIQSFPDEGLVKLNFVTASDRNFKNTTTRFKDGSNLYLQITSSHKGFINIFYIDNISMKVYRLFPGPNNNEMNSVPLKGDKVYTLFAGTTEFPEHPISNELSTSFSSDIKPQIDELVIIYSESDIRKPVLTLDQSARLFTLSIEEFYTWKAGIYNKSNQITVAKIPITIE